MRTQNKFAKIVALLSLLAIIGSVVGTGILILFAPSVEEQLEQELTPEEIQKLIQGASNTGGMEKDINTLSQDFLTGETLSGGVQ